MGRGCAHTPKILHFVYQNPLAPYLGAFRFRFAGKNEGPVRQGTGPLVLPTGAVLSVESTPANNSPNGHLRINWGGLRTALFYLRTGPPLSRILPFLTRKSSQTGAKIRFLAPEWQKIQKTTVRLSHTVQAYLEDLAKVGAYGKGKAGVMRRFIENGIMAALQGGVINKRDIRDLGESPDEDETA